MKLIFLFSLPRSGSTLLQRLIASHPQVATVSEPWLVLPYLYTLRGRGIYAEFDYKTSSTAIQDFCEELPNGRNDYLLEVRELIERLYAKAAGEEVMYFLDKTPRYHLIVNEIFKLFPESKKIFLWRNPLAVMTSIMSTWGRGRWNLYRYKVDLFQGLENLIDAYQTGSDGAASICFEELLVEPERELRRIFSYLELDFDPAWLASFHKVELKGRPGDPTGGSQYQSISQDPLKKWEKAMVNPVRKAWCRSYLKGIGRERLQVMGYDLEGLLAQLDSLPRGTSLMLSDTWRMLYGAAYCLLEPDLAKRKLKEADSWREVLPHL